MTQLIFRKTFTVDVTCLALSGKPICIVWTWILIDVCASVIAVLCNIVLYWTVL